MKLLILNSSILGDNSASKQLTEAYAAAWRQANPQGDITVRDLAADPVPAMTSETMAAWSTPNEQRTERQQTVAAPADALIQAVSEHDQLLIAAPMYNFSVPAQLKNVMDSLARAGVTFRYTENGPEGLLGKGKKVVVIRTSGGKYQNTPADSMTPLLQTFFGFIGFSDFSQIWAEGLAMGEEAAQLAMNTAKADINRQAA